ncbi:GAF and ANTAR domain-containing protein [Rhodococcus sp. BP-241]|uniref:GAF and ANTAR domain-containing protein n=1 Tax=Rhodococcus sp. BP-241 TaxID=2739441 RepID=UPI001C9AF2EF|nr:GAF and ANTAR domain-containing protein [Rhodococcus sp. BP-241]MBY6709078.1 GAF and ANTAR domain-containing protein [Rhodococcus sp. BP-241]
MSDDGPGEGHADLLAQVRRTNHFRRAHAMNGTALDTLVSSISIPVSDDADLLAVMDIAAAAAVAMLPGVGHAGITARSGGEPFTVSPTDDVVFALDAVQYILDDGPCLRAMRRRAHVHLTLTDARRLWPALAEIADGTAVVRFRAAPISVDGRAVGTLNLYCTDDPLPSPEDRYEADVIDVLVDYVDAALRTLGVQHDLEQSVDSLRTVIEQRRVISIAVGAVMVERDVSIDRARRILDDHARSTGEPTHEVATQFVARLDE